MARLTPDEYLKKWGTRLKAAGPDITAGIQRTTVAPGQKAAKQSAVMLSKLTDAVNSGRWARNVAAVSLEDWKQAAATKGVPRIGIGVDAAVQSGAEMASKLLANVDAVSAIVEKTPRADLQTNIQRMVTWANEMAARKIK